MSREIEYRVWDKQDKQYRKIAALTFGGKYVFLYPGEGCRLTPEAERCGLCGGAGFKMTDSMDRDRLVFEQYTGLLDRNGKKIYEGDIVLDYYDGDDAFIVEWNKDTASFILTGTDNIANVSFDNFYSDKDLEVIGNVHENLELLGGKE